MQCLSSGFTVDFYFCAATLMPAFEWKCDLKEGRITSEFPNFASVLFAHTRMLSTACLILRRLQTPCICGACVIHFYIIPDVPCFAYNRNLENKMRFLKAAFSGLLMCSGRCVEVVAICTFQRFMDQCHLSFYYLLQVCHLKKYFVQCYQNSLSR